MKSATIRPRSYKRQINAWRESENAVAGDFDDSFTISKEIMFLTTTLKPMNDVSCI